MITDIHTGENNKKEDVVSEWDETMLSKLVEDTVSWQLTSQLIPLQRMKNITRLQNIC